MSAERLVSLSVTPPVDHEVTARLDGAGRGSAQAREPQVRGRSCSPSSAVVSAPKARRTV